MRASLQQKPLIEFRRQQPVPHWPADEWAGDEIHKQMWDMWDFLQHKVACKEQNYNFIVFLLKWFWDREYLTTEFRCLFCVLFGRVVVIVLILSAGLPQWKYESGLDLNSCEPRWLLGSWGWITDEGWWANGLCVARGWQQRVLVRGSRDESQTVEMLIWWIWW